jgi:hypothetical protein
VVDNEARQCFPCKLDQSKHRKRQCIESREANTIVMDNAFPTLSNMFLDGNMILLTYNYDQYSLVHQLKITTIIGANAIFTELTLVLQTLTTRVIVATIVVDVAATARTTRRFACEFTGKERLCLAVVITRHNTSAVCL